MVFYIAPLSVAKMFQGADAVAEVAWHNIAWMDGTVSSRWGGRRPIERTAKPRRPRGGHGAGTLYSGTRAPWGVIGVGDGRAARDGAAGACADVCDDLGYGEVGACVASDRGGKCGIGGVVLRSGV